MQMIVCSTICHQQLRKQWKKNIFVPIKPLIIILDEHLSKWAEQTADSIK